MRKNACFFLLLLVLSLISTENLHADSSMIETVLSSSIELSTSSDRFEITVPSPMEQDAINMSVGLGDSLGIIPYVNGGQSLEQGAPGGENSGSLDLVLSFGGGVLVDSKVLGVFADAKARVVAKYILMCCAVGFEGRAGVIIHTSESSGVYVGGVFYRHMGYNSLQEVSLNSNIRAIEFGVTESSQNSSSVVKRSSYFIRYGKVELLDSPYFAFGAQFDLGWYFALVK